MAKEKETTITVYDLHVMEFPTKTYSGFGGLARVQRVGDDLHFYGDDDIDSEVYAGRADDYVVSTSLFARIVERLHRGSVVEDRGSYTYEKTSDEDVRWRAPCGEIRTVKLAVLEEIVAEFR